MLGRAFATDPLAVWALAPGSGEAEVSRFFALPDGAFVDDGWLWEAGEGAGVALWVPPDGGARYIEGELQTRTQVGDLTDDEGARYGLLWNWVEEHLPEEPHWFLDHVAVDPDQHGRGIGSVHCRGSPLH